MSLDTIKNNFIANCQSYSSAGLSNNHFQSKWSYLKQLRGFNDLIENIRLLNEKIDSLTTNDFFGVYCNEFVDVIDDNGEKRKVYISDYLFGGDSLIFHKFDISRQFIESVDSQLSLEIENVRNEKKKNNISSFVETEEELVILEKLKTKFYFDIQQYYKKVFESFDLMMKEMFVLEVQKFANSKAGKDVHISQQDLADINFSQEEKVIVAKYVFEILKGLAAGSLDTSAIQDAIVKPDIDDDRLEEYKRLRDVCIRSLYGEGFDTGEGYQGLLYRTLLDMKSDSDIKENARFFEFINENKTRLVEIMKKSDSFKDIHDDDEFEYTALPILFSILSEYGQDWLIYQKVNRVNLSQCFAEDKKGILETCGFLINFILKENQNCAFFDGCKFLDENGVPEKIDLESGYESLIENSQRYRQSNFVLNEKFASALMSMWKMRSLEEDSSVFRIENEGENSFLCEKVVYETDEGFFDEVVFDFGYFVKVKRWLLVDESKVPPEDIMILRVGGEEYKVSNKEFDITMYYFCDKECNKGIQLFRFDKAYEYVEHNQRGKLKVTAPCHAHFYSLIDAVLKKLSGTRDLGKMDISEKVLLDGENKSDSRFNHLGFDDIERLFNECCGIKEVLKVQNYQVIDERKNLDEIEKD